MNTKAKLIVSAALLALATAPASARIDGDDGYVSAYPRFTKERSHMVDRVGAAPSRLINRPRVQR